MRKNGFTMIELIIIVTIIGILSSIMIVSYGNVQAKSRDSRRKADIEALAGAVQMYKTDYKKYPVLGVECSGYENRVNSTNVGTGTAHRWDITFQNLIKDYITVPIPIDPINKRYGLEAAIWSSTAMSNAKNEFYSYNGASNSYILGARLEVSDGNGPLLSGANWLTGCSTPSNTSTEIVTSDTEQLKKLYITGQNLSKVSGS